MEPAFRKRIIDMLLSEKEKEYLCHVQFVVEIGCRLAKEYGVDQDIIEAACLLHDIGRDNELSGENHCQAGVRLAAMHLPIAGFSENQVATILSCILSHNSREVPATIEEQIVRTADGGSKIQYHEAFMLLCNKKTYKERLFWGLKYLQKGYSSISLDPYREEIEQKYQTTADIYNKILKL